MDDTNTIGEFHFISFAESYMRNKLSIFIVSLFLSLVSTSSFSKIGEFPGRETYPELPFIELTDLYTKLHTVTIVDTRSKLEFETLRIKGAINIPVASDSFEKEILKLRSQSNNTIVFYCNGRSCMKSYHAVKKSLAVGVRDVYAYDAGIFEWTIAHPEVSVLLEQNPVNKKSLISKGEFQKRLLNPDNFSTKLMDLGSQAMVIDVRDKYQRLGVGFYPGKERWASLDDLKKVEKFIKKAKDSNKTLFIYDEVGKQVRWLQYALEKHGLKNYYFMDKGAHAYYAGISTWKN